MWLWLVDPLSLIIIWCNHYISFSRIWSDWIIILNQVNPTIHPKCHVSYSIPSTPTVTVCLCALVFLFTVYSKICFIIRYREKCIKLVLNLLTNYFKIFDFFSFILYLNLRFFRWCITFVPYFHLVLKYL